MTAPIMTPRHALLSRIRDAAEPVRVINLRTIVRAEATNAQGARQVTIQSGKLYLTPEGREALERLDDLHAARTDPRQEAMTLDGERVRGGRDADTR